MLESWWKESGEECPTEDKIPSDGAFVLEVDGNPILSVCVYRTLATGFCLIGGFIGNPNMKGEVRREAGNILQIFIEGYARSYGHNQIFCYSYKDQLSDRYKQLGYKIGEKEISLMKGI